MRTRHVISAAILGLISLSACSASTSPTTDTKYVQTWTTSYTDTTCADYLNAMTDKQRWVMAADVLTSARKVDGGNTVPADSQTTRFESDLATACKAEATAKVTEVAVAIYKLDSTYQP